MSQETATARKLIESIDLAVEFVESLPRRVLSWQPGTVCVAFERDLCRFRELDGEMRAYASRLLLGVDTPNRAPFVLEEIGFTRLCVGVVGQLDDLKPGEALRESLRVDADEWLRRIHGLRAAAMTLAEAAASSVRGVRRGKPWGWQKLAELAAHMIPGWLEGEQVTNEQLDQLFTEYEPFAGEPRDDGGRWPELRNCDSPRVILNAARRVAKRKHSNGSWWPT